MEKLRATLCAILIFFGMTSAGFRQMCAATGTGGDRLVKMIANGENLEYTDDGKKTTDYFYDGAGRLIREQSTAQLDGQKTIEYEYTYQYDGTGTLLSRHFKAQPGYFEYESHYDRHGHLMDSYAPYSSIGPINGLWTGKGQVRCEYDAEGNLTRAIVDGVMYTYEYDKAGNILSVRNTDPLTADISFTYLPGGGYLVRWDFSGKANDSSDSTVWEWEYDSDGKPVHCIGVRPETQEYVEDLWYSYDGEGNLIRLEGKDKWSSESRLLISKVYIYEYDSRGNLESSYEYDADECGRPIPGKNALMIRHYYYE